MEAEGIKERDLKAKKINEYIRLYNQHYNTLSKRIGAFNDGVNFNS